ncbi:AbrB/MazE/SpoVT family DNA-binding domain-containing protein [Candidatus Halobonum tyrrellensis]|uniref:AbrB/MazE/SpoVT family DNA-binding domain-containing protein n=1 Tax=Candidatus Halobonum tyrrellensis TaxID=1431545 RepID=UPI0006777590|nr:AbrB/MazE/SpoVT family DNA-binding domain-containing protein [Candidatus Halobonum tyrrellensis]
MPRVDSDGHLVIPQDIRDEMGMRPGTVVDIRIEDGRLIIESEQDPEEFWENHLEMIREMSEERHEEDRPAPPYEEMDALGRSHIDSIQEMAKRAESKRCE